MKVKLKNPGGQTNIDKHRTTTYIYNFGSNQKFDGNNGKFTYFQI